MQIYKKNFLKSFKNLFIIKNRVKKTMDNSNYNLLAAKVGAFDKVAVLSNDIANTNSIGYKKDNLTFDK